MEESKKFARWIMIYTKEVPMSWVTREFKDKIMNIDELYEEFLKTQLW